MFITERFNGYELSKEFFDAMLTQELDWFFIRGIDLSDDTFFVYLMM